MFKSFIAGWLGLCRCRGPDSALLCCFGQAAGGGEAPRGGGAGPAARVAPRAAGPRPRRTESPSLTHGESGSLGSRCDVFQMRRKHCFRVRRPWSTRCVIQMPGPECRDANFYVSPPVHVTQTSNFPADVVCDFSQSLQLSLCAVLAAR